MKKKILLILLLSITFIGITYAKNYDKNYLILNDEITIDNDISNSSIIAGYDIKLNNKIDGVGLIFGNDILFNSITDYFAIFGNNITFDGKTRDGIIFGNKVILNEGSTIGRDVIVFANSVTISGSINRNVIIHAKDITIKDAQISGNVKLNAETINIDRNADIIGELSYNDDAKINISEVASVGSTKTFTAKKDITITIIDKLKASLINLVNILVIFAILLYLLPKAFTKLSNKKKDIIKNLGIGLVFLIIVPITAVILLFTVFGLSLAILLMIIYIIIIYLSTIATGYILGNFIWEKIIKIEKKPYLIGVTGIIILTLLKLIPYVKWLVIIISSVIGTGSIISLYHRKK